MLTPELEPPARAAIYRLLARALQRELDAEALAALREPQVVRALESAAPGAGASLQAWDAGAHAEDFARLFLLPGGAPPRASAWIPGERERLGAAIAREVHAALEALGRAQVGAAGIGRLPEDHAGLVFEVAAHALSADPAEGARLVKATLLPWAEDFGRALTARATTPLYRALGVLVQALHPRETP